jgi:tetratricopeptide (TPR) repeat protein
MVELERWTPESVRQLLARQRERLAPEEQRVLEAASLAGLEFSAATVAAALETAAIPVEDHCGRLAEQQQFLRLAGMSDWPDGTRAARYGFLHALYQEFWHERVSVGQQQQWHLRIGERKEVAYGQRAGEIAAELALHFEQGRDYRKAVHYLQQARENAARRSAYQEVINHFTTGLELLKTLADTPERVQQELTLQLALGDALVAVKGYTVPDVEKTLTRAWKLCQQLGETPQFFPVLLRLWLFYRNRAELQTAHGLAEQLIRLAQSAQDRYLLSLAHWTLGCTLYLLGELTSARPHLEQAITLYDPQQHPRPTVHTADPRVNCLSYASWTLWTLGYPDQGLQRSHEALALAGGLSHPFSLAFALWFAAVCHLFRREEQVAREQAEVVMTLSTEQGFPFWLAAGMGVRDCALAEQGQVQEGIAQMRQSREPYYLALLAEAYRKMGQVEEGLAVLAKALALVDKTGQRMGEAELYRLKGELTLQKKARGWRLETSPSSPQASSLQPQVSRVVEQETEGYFLKAIEIARRQSAKAWELRAVMSLSRLWQRQCKKAEARRMLAEIYGWFTEGFDTKDLQEAKTLLEELT